MTPPPLHCLLGLHLSAGARVGAANVAETIALGAEKLLRHHIYVNERCQRISPQRVVIMDMEGMSRHHLDRRGLAILKQFIEVDLRNHVNLLIFIKVDQWNN